MPRSRPLQNGQRLLFARTFFRHPLMLGSVIPSSRFLIREVLDPIHWGRAHVIVEYGPGVGTITGEILERMRPNATLIAIETNPDFVHYLREAYPDERLRVVQGSAADVRTILRQHGFANASYIISGIPFSTLPAPDRERILRDTKAALEPGGSFLVYQFSSRVLADLKRIFGDVERGFQLLNILPAHLFFCTQNAGAPELNGHAVRER
jgi:phospholipid N-methyltransferase